MSYTQITLIVEFKDGNNFNILFRFNQKDKTFIDPHDKLVECLS